MEVLQIIHTNKDTQEVTIYREDEVSGNERQDKIRQRKLTEIAKTLGSDYKVRTELPKEGS